MLDTRQAGQEAQAGLEGKDDERAGAIRGRRVVLEKMARAVGGPVALDCWGAGSKGAPGTVGGEHEWKRRLACLACGPGKGYYRMKTKTMEPPGAALVR